MREKNIIKILLISFGVIIIVTALLFLYNEHIDTRKRINHSKFASFFTIVAALGTAISIYLLYRQLHLMTAQIELQKPKPDVLLENSTFYLKAYYNKNGTLLTTTSSDEDMLNTVYLPSIKLYNAGSGIAYNVVLVWKIPNRSQSTSAVEHIHAKQNNSVLLPRDLWFHLSQAYKNGVLKNEMYSTDQDSFQITVDINYTGEDGRFYKRQTAVNCYVHTKPSMDEATPVEITFENGISS